MSDSVLVEVVEPLEEGSNDCNVENKEFDNLDEELDLVEPLEEESDGCNVQINEPYIGMEFANLDEIYTFYNSYARKLGFGVRKNSSSKSKVTGDIIWKNYVCDKAGKKDEKIIEGNDLVRRRRGTRVGCQAKLDVRKYTNGKWFISGFVKEHNHVLDTPRRTIKHRSHNRSHKSILATSVMDELHESGIGPSNIAKMLNAGSTNTSISAQNVIDHLRKDRKNQVGKEGVLVVQYLQLQVSIDASFFYSIELDEDGYLRSIFWADSRSRNDYLSFGDVISFDVTYKTNNLMMPFAPFTGVNHHRQSILLGCGLLADETQESFTWLFQQWLKCMFNRAPTVILTDMDPAMFNAIKIVFPNTRHHFCSWHIHKHLVEHIYEMRDAQSDFSKDYKQWYKSRSIETSESAWFELLKKYGLENNKWLNRMWERRLHWVPAFQKGFFVAGMSSTSRSESINAYFDGFVNSSTHLLEFVQHYEKALKARRHSEEVEDFRTINSMACLIGNTSIELHASKCYTRSIFNIFQSEFKQVLDCWHQKMDHLGDKVTYLVGLSSVPKEKWYSVEFINSMPISVRCECAKFETDGILCKHCLHILCKKQITQIPDKYILHRWTIQARHLLLYGGSKVAESSSITPIMKWNITCMFNKLVEKCSTSEVAFKELYSIIHQRLEDFNIETSKTNLEANEDQRQSIVISGVEIHDPIKVRTKGRPKIASRIPSGIESSKDTGKQRTCGACGSKGHYSTTCPRKKEKN